MTDPNPAVAPTAIGGTPRDYRATAMIRRLLVEEALPHWSRLLRAFLLMAVSAGSQSLVAYLVGDIINAAYVSRSFETIVWLSLVAFALFTANGVATYGQAVILTRIGNAVLARSQRRLFSKLMHESVGFFADRHSSEFLTRLTTGANAVIQALSLIVTSVGRDIMSVIGLGAVMVWQDPIMSLVCLLVAPPVLFVLRKLVRRIRGLARTQFTGTADIVETMQESLQGITTVKAFTLEQTMQQRIDTNIEVVRQNADKMARVSNRASPLMETLAGFAVAATLIYSGYRVVETDANPGQFFSFLTAFLLAYEPAKRLARVNIDLNSALVLARTLFEIIDSPQSEPDDGDKPVLQLSTNRVELRDVTFAYRRGETVLDRINLVAEPGKITALVGPSGGGKSTILNLILRLYEVGDGAILIDRQDIAGVSRNSLRQAIGYVGQDVFLFRATIRDNIAFGKPGASFEEIVAAARVACAHDFIMSFPLGYDTPVGEHGTQLSGGQRQRIAVARAVLKNAPIILLDEATAALDSESEKQVQEAVQHLCQGRTTLVIAHRLHTIMHADAIHVIEAGQVVETGRHDDLLRRGGRYASFFRLQHRDVGPLALVATSA
jgi:ABC-type multidrug transport system fused ATPase/permease subunit